MAAPSPRGVPPRSAAQRPDIARASVGPEGRTESSGAPNRESECRPGGSYGAPAAPRYRESECRPGGSYGAPAAPISRERVSARRVVRSSSGAPISRERVSARRVVRSVVVRQRVAAADAVGREDVEARRGEVVAVVDEVAVVAERRVAAPEAVARLGRDAACPRIRPRGRRGPRRGRRRTASPARTPTRG